ncbi:hypothetical protein KKC34_12340 [bacterium]|nr:hypothetical protein [bacterium]
MSHDEESINYKFIKTLEIEDVLLIESNHKVYEMYIEDTKLDLNIAKPDETNIIVTDEYIVFEISVDIRVSRTDNTLEDDKKILLLETSAKFGAIYKYQNLDDWSENSIQGFASTFFRFSAVTHILAFAREHFYSQMIKSGYPRLHIPLIKSLLDEDGEAAASQEISTIMTKEEDKN